MTTLLSEDTLPWGYPRLLTCVGSHGIVAQLQRSNLPHPTQPYLDNSCDSGIGLFDAIRQSLSPQFPHGPV